MIDRLRSALSYANVMSTIAVFSVLGGGAYAAQKIGAKDIKKNAVRAKHIKKNQIATKHLKKRAVTGAKIATGAVSASKLATGAVTTTKLADGAVTGPKVDESTLGPVPNADRLDGLDSLDFVRGKGRSYAIRGSDPFGGPTATLATLDVGGNLVLECRNPASVGSDVTFVNTSGTPADVWTDRTQDGFAPGTTLNYSAVVNGGTATIAVSGPVVDSGQNLLRFTIAIGDRVTEVEARVRAIPGSACQLTALVSESRT
ncbi:MAG TPA: hypothetical protein VEW67_06835 [Thermoleophilaceae bacterium]|nr:hypothetical protein [Thermoleophilaceae bacterium]